MLTACYGVKVRRWRWGPFVRVVVIAAIGRGFRSAGYSLVGLN